jgi:hypothetical protein
MKTFIQYLIEDKSSALKSFGLSKNHANTMLSATAQARYHEKMSAHHEQNGNDKLADEHLNHADRFVRVASNIRTKNAKFTSKKQAQSLGDHMYNHPHIQSALEVGDALADQRIASGKPHMGADSETLKRHMKNHLGMDESAIYECMNDLQEKLEQDDDKIFDASKKDMNWTTDTNAAI